MEGTSFSENNCHLILNNKHAHKTNLDGFSEKENELMQYDGLGDTQ